MSLKSTQGPIDVFLCPEDSSGACSPVAGSSPAKAMDPSLLPEQPAHQSKASMLEERSPPSPASTSSTATAASQQDPPAPLMGNDSGELYFEVDGHLSSFGNFCHRNNETSSVCIQNLKHRDFTLENKV